MHEEPAPEIIEPRHWLIRAKLEAPRHRVPLVHRPRLLDLLDEALGLRLCLIIAPAGFGKTTLLAQWRSKLLEQGAKVAWLTLDEGDADVRQFLCYVVFALSAAGVDMDRLLVLAEQGLSELPVDRALGALLEAVARHEGQVVLALDDYHRAQIPEADVLVNRMVETAPGHLTVVINSRARPNLALPQLLAAGQAVEIDAEALRFSMEETRIALDPVIAGDRLQLLFQRTEGWAMAIQLARLIADGDRGGARLLESFHGRGGHLATYLADQVLAELPGELQEFLMQTAILERFNASLADEVTGRNDSREMLHRLEPLHSFLVPLDEGAAWFRYHHLFADHLQDQLHRRHPESVRTLHLRASRWFEDNGYLMDAVRHARVAGDYECCARLIEAAGGWELVLFGGIGQLRNLMRNIPDRELERFPRLQAAKAYLAMKDGQLFMSRALYEAARANPAGLDAQADTSQGLGRDLLNLGVLQNAYEDRMMTPADLERLRALERDAPEGDGVTRGVLCCASVVAGLALGRFQEAQGICSRAIRAMRGASSVLGLNYCYLHAGLAAFYQASFRIAEANFLEARRMAEDNFGADSGLKSLASVLLGAVRFWRDEWQKGDLEEFRAALDHVEQYDGWFDIYLTGLDVEVAAMVGTDGEAGSDAGIERAQRIGTTRGIQRLTHCADAWRLSMLVRCGETAEAERVARRIDGSFRPGICRDVPFLWVPWQFAGNALADWHAGRNRAQALYCLDDVIDCCRTLRADFFLIRALIRKALLLDQSGRRSEALEPLLEALRLAAPEGIRTPFRCTRTMYGLLHAAQKRARTDAADMLTLNFIGSCLDTARETGVAGARDTEGLFSPREYEVVLELMQGHSNKEIARALDLTEHTVKYHLKNIFAKLNVSRRAEAIAAVQRLHSTPRN